MNETILNAQDAGEMAIDDLISLQIQILDLKLRYKKAVSKIDRSNYAIKINNLRRQIETMTTWKDSLNGVSDAG